MNMSYKEFRAFANEHYCEGGDVIIEYWDERDYNDYTRNFGPMTKAKAWEIFNVYKEQELAAEHFGNW